MLIYLNFGRNKEQWGKKLMVNGPVGSYSADNDHRLAASAELGSRRRNGLIGFVMPSRCHGRKRGLHSEDCIDKSREQRVFVMAVI